MTAARRSPTAEGVAGLDLRSVLAPAPFSRALAFALVAELALGAADAALGAEVVIAALLVFPPLVMAMTARVGDTAVAALVAVAVAGAGPFTGAMEAGDVVVSLLVVAAGGIVAVVVAVARTGTAVALERFRLLSGVAAAADRPTQSEFTGAVREVLVPAFADAVGVTLSEAEAEDGVDASGRAVRVPLRSRGRPLGELTCSVAASRRRYSASDLRFAGVLAGRVALALDNAGLTSDLSVAQEQLGTVVRTLAEAVTISDASGHIVYANDAAVELLRVDSIDDLVGAEPGDIMARYDVFDESGGTVGFADLPGERVRAGETGVKPMLVRNVVRATGEERWLLNKITTLRDAEGRIARVVNVIEDVTEVKRAEQAQRDIAETLQHGLLPPELPEIPGWSSAVLYRPAGEFNAVGGDFYDVFAGAGGWMLVIGDIAGQGAEAAVRTSLARFTVRTAAELTGDVGRAVQQLNDTLRGQAGLPLCTAVCAGLATRPDGSARLTMASAGHPPPLLVRGREVRPIGEAGTIAGAFDGEDWPAAAVHIEPGDVVVFYTDGVLDAVGEDGRFGERRLRDALAAAEGGVHERLAALRTELDAFQRGPQRDDTTVLVLEYGGAPAQDAAVGEGAREVAR